MDLRGRLNEEQKERACAFLGYQPFIITDDIQTGAAYSWAYGADPRVAPTLLFRRHDYNVEQWTKITEANARCRRMYDDFVAEIAKRYPGGTWLDFACNNGYFPIAAERSGMRGVGVDMGPQYARSIELLNEACGTNAEFINAAYDSQKRSAPIDGKYAVVSASAILCHLPDPLHFLAFLGSLASEAIFYFGQLIDTDALLVSYLRPHPALGREDEIFPYRFNSDVRLSKSLLYHGFEEMGFREIVELPWSNDWLSPYYSAGYWQPEMPVEGPSEVRRAWRLDTELRETSRHLAILAMR